MPIRELLRFDVHKTELSLAKSISVLNYLFIFFT